MAADHPQALERTARTAYAVRGRAPVLRDGARSRVGDLHFTNDFGALDLDNFLRKA